MPTRGKQRVSRRGMAYSRYDRCPTCGRTSAKFKRALATSRRERLAAKGRCPSCGDPMPIGAERVTCDRCLRYRRKSMSQLHAERASRALCARCGGATDPGLKMCGICLKKQRERLKRNHIDGFCRCGAFRAPGRMSCERCLRYGRLNIRRRRAAKAALTAVRVES